MRASVVSNLCFCMCGLSTRTGYPNTVRLPMKVKAVSAHVSSLREKKQLQLQLFLLHYTIKFSVKVISVVCSGLRSFPHSADINLYSSYHLSVADHTM